MRSSTQWALGGLVAAVATVLVVLALRPAAQFGPDPAVAKTVDALFTALTAQDPAMLGKCEAKLADHRRAGRLPDDAAAELARLVDRARGGDWRGAAERLYALIEGQRR